MPGYIIEQAFDFFRITIGMQYEKKRQALHSAQVSLRI